MIVPIIEYYIANPFTVKLAIVINHVSLCLINNDFFCNSACYYIFDYEEGGVWRGKMILLWKKVNLEKKQSEKSRK